MSTTMRPRHGHHDLRRSAVLLVPGLTLVAVMALAMAQGALAAAVGVSGTAFSVTADSVSGEAIAGYPTALRTPDGRSTQSLLLSFRKATIHNLCLAAGVDVPVVGHVAVELTSGGDADSVVTVTDFTAEADRVTGRGARATGLVVGADAGTLTTGVGGTTGPKGQFGLQSSTLTVDGFRSTARSITTGTMTLSGISLKALHGQACR